MKALKTFGIILLVLFAIFSVVGIVGLVWFYLMEMEIPEGSWELDEEKPKKASKSIKIKPTKVVTKNISKPSNLNERQEKILKEIQDRKKVKASEVKNKFKEINERTLRRDFEKMEKLGMVKQMGKTKNSFYEYVHN